MLTVRWQSKRQLLRSFGTCLNCMRKAFLFAGVSWILSLSIWMLRYNQTSCGIIFFASIILTVIWALHLIAFSIRSTAWSERKKKTIEDSSQVVVGRRNVVAVFARAFSFSVVITAVPRLAWAKRQPCGGSSYDPDLWQCCCTGRSGRECVVFNTMHQSCGYVCGISGCA